MSIRNEWRQGLQWGGCAWLGWVAWSSFLHAWHCPLFPGPDFLPSLGWFTYTRLLAAVWIAALLLSWTRWSRAGVAVAIAMQAIVGSIGAAMKFDLWWSITVWIPMSLPVIPLIFMEPERPRLTLALLMVGRWRDACAQLKGWRWLLVAVGTALLNRVGWSMLGTYYFVSPVPVWLLPPLLFLLAAIPRRHKPATA
jgi:hypothetical protein